MNSEKAEADWTPSMLISVFITSTFFCGALEHYVLSDDADYD